MGKRQTSYDKGASAERYVKGLLEQAGYTVVRAAGSKGAADLVAANARVVYAIQVKRNHLSPKQMRKEGKKLLDWIGDSMYQPMIAHKKSKSKNSRYEFVAIRGEMMNEVSNNRIKNRKSPQKKTRLKKKRYPPTMWKQFQRLYKKQNKNKFEDPIGHAIIDLGDGLVIDIHTDVNLYDMTNERAWKGDLV